MGEMFVSFSHLLSYSTGVGNVVVISDVNRSIVAEVPIPFGAAGLACDSSTGAYFRSASCPGPSWRSPR